MYVLHRHIRLLFSWKHRRMWPIIIENITSTLWSFCFVLLLVLWILCIIANVPIRLGASPLPALWGTVIATITLTDPCGTVSGSTLTLDLDPDIEVAASAAGDLAAAVITDGDDNTVISGLTVGTSGTDIVVDSVTVASGQLVRVTTGTITHA